MTDTRARILVVEDDPSIGPRIAAGLLRVGFDTVLAADGLQARTLLLQGRFSLVILDLMLPGMDGFALLEAWRDRSSVPVIVLTARTALDDRLQSFQLGAADWLPKPFFMEELITRVRVRLGRTAIAQPERVVAFGDCVLDLDARRVCRDGAVLPMTAHEVNLLVVLVTNAGRVFTRAQLAERALPAEGDRSPRTVDSHIYRIRRKLGEAGGGIRTVFGVGYRFDAPAS